MTTQLAFQSSLPRSGSTLFSNIVGQNLAFHVTPISDAQLSRSFRASFLKGCKSGKTPNVSNQNAYCTCMANGYQARYDGRTLTAVSQLAGSMGQQGPGLVNLMMQPEGKRCVAGS